ncbi:putative pyrophosphatase or phosphodiesterase, AlkP superfamily [Cyclonatronum proteinivorum]|uniref:Putative pyrophosphatase or phosphodiesterase, AlkP superfamily n=1 Tax=Cyclonatronum proteinivorum TaxID=1457365 RepID=A0A345UPI1_9BACT|nr:ectonucleotide pyrophosphatase/phosphodiesterase [Cyclonatronum proteinivorum]AXJ02383.1 putative pyrophosphatase or phosphodiesterase, AlkP superfamily [Cyclonatronum proteinivorum]
MKRKLLLLSALMLTWVLTGCNEKETEPNTLLLVSIDGLKPSYLERTHTPTLDSLITKGVLAESMIPVFPTSTFPNHYSLVTGLYTENTGVISNTMFDEEIGRFFRLSDRSAVGDGRWYGGEPLWVTAEKQNTRTATMFWPGSEAEIKGIRPTRWSVFDNSVTYEMRADSVLTWLALEDETRPDFITLYFSRVDSRGHSHGPYHEETMEALTYVDGILNTIMNGIRGIGLEDQVNILITSDHGMIDLSEDRLVFLDDIIDLDTVNVINWSPVVMLQPTEGNTELVYNQLKAAEDNFRVFMREDLPERWRFGGHHRVPDVVAVADLGWTITSRSFFERRGILAGTHGFDNAYPDMHAFFLASGPDFHEGKVIEPFSVVHIYELMAHLLNLEPAENDGDLSVLLPIVNRR